MKLTPKRYEPRHHPQWHQDKHGGLTATVYADEGLVKVFTYPGGDQGEAFTTLSMWLSPHVYHLTLPRHYHRRWINRLATDFAWECGKLAEADAAPLAAPAGKGER